MEGNVPFIFENRILSLNETLEHIINFTLL